jgi:6,7-dimethyl-8-ribityllumazine synthase
MSNKPGSVPPKLDATGLTIGVVQSRFNEAITNALWEACYEELKSLGIEDQHLLHVTVPGALEIPFALKKLADTQGFDALIALGAVIKGDTYHFELVCNESAAGVSRVSQDADIPVVNAVLTTYTEEQAQERTLEKGTDAARVAVEMANLALDLEDALYQAAGEVDSDE